MTKLPRISGRDCASALLKIGFQFKRPGSVMDFPANEASVPSDWVQAIALCEEMCNRPRLQPKHYAERTVAAFKKCARLDLARPATPIVNITIALFALHPRTKL